MFDSAHKHLLVARELQDFRKSLRCRTASVDKARLLMLLETAVGEGKEGLSHQEIVSALQEQGAQVGQITLASVKKALHDLGRQLEHFYARSPGRGFRIQISSSGRVSRDHAHAAESLERQMAAFEVVTAALPDALKVLMPMRRGHGAPSDMRRGRVFDSRGPAWLADVLPACRTEIAMLSPAQLGTARDTLARLVLHHIASLVAHHRGDVVAVQLPVHDVKAWDEALGVLDDAYLTYTSLTHQRIVRIVILPDAEELGWWKKLWQHINTRVRRGEWVWATTQACAQEFKPGFDHDLILIRDSLIALVQLDDEYAKHMVGVHPDDQYGNEIQSAVIEAQASMKASLAASDGRFLCCERDTFECQFSREQLDRWLAGFCGPRPECRS